MIHLLSRLDGGQAVGGREHVSVGDERSTTLMTPILEATPSVEKPQRDHPRKLGDCERRVTLWI